MVDFNEIFQIDHDQDYRISGNNEQIGSIGDVHNNNGVGLLPLDNHNNEWFFEHVLSFEDAPYIMDQFTRMHSLSNHGTPRLASPRLILSPRRNISPRRGGGNNNNFNIITDTTRGDESLVAIGDNDADMAQMHEDDLTHDLRNIPELLKMALNTANTIELKNIFLKYFENECAILFKATDRLSGREYIFNHYQAMINKLSNYSFQYTLKSIMHRLMIIEEACLGTILPVQNDEEFQQLWNCFNVFNFENDFKKMSSQELLYDTLVRHQKPVLFTIKSEMFLVMNDDMTRFQHVLWQEVTLDVFPGNNTLFTRK
jgi:hypothetical protein